MFEITDTMIIDQILMHPEFLKKDKKENRMYSSALKHYMRYTKQLQDEKSELLIKKVMSKDQIANMVDLEYEEGMELLRLHKVRERNPQLIKDAKKQFKELHGELYCEACGINFEKMYGERGKDFIEGHHKKLISEMNESETTKIEDIVMLCSNCHSMIHRPPMLSIEELKLVLKIIRG